MTHQKRFEEIADEAIELALDICDSYKPDPFNDRPFFDTDKADYLCDLLAWARDGYTTEMHPLTGENVTRLQRPRRENS